MSKLAEEQYHYVENLFTRTCDALQRLSQLDFVENPEPQLLCETAIGILDSKDCCLISVLLSEDQESKPKVIYRTEGFPIDNVPPTKIMEKIKGLEANSQATKGSIESDATLTVNSQRVFCIGFQQTICDKKLKYALAITGRCQPPLPKSAPNTQYPSYDDHAIRSVLAVCLSFLKTRIDKVNEEFLRACDNRSPEPAVEAGTHLFEFKKLWGIPASAEAVERFLGAYLMLVSQPHRFNRHNRWSEELERMRSYIRECKKSDKDEDVLNGLLGRITAACLVSSNLGSFRERQKWISEFVEKGMVSWNG